MAMFCSWGKVRKMFIMLTNLSFSMSSVSRHFPAAVITPTEWFVVHKSVSFLIFSVKFCSSTIVACNIHLMKFPFLAVNILHAFCSRFGLLVSMHQGNMMKDTKILILSSSTRYISAGHHVSHFFFYWHISAKSELAFCPLKPLLKTLNFLSDSPHSRAMLNL